MNDFKFISYVPRKHTIILIPCLQASPWKVVLLENL